MPFKSEKQRRFMHANKPEIAARWEREAKEKPHRETTAAGKRRRRPAGRKKR